MLRSRIFYPLITFSFLLVSLISCQTESIDRLDLSGTWKFKMDTMNIGIRQAWFNQEFSETIQLPGSMAENGKGFDVSVNTKWTGSIIDKSWYTDEKYANYRNPDNLKLPFWLTPEKHYVGVAWYSRIINIPEKLDDHDFVLTLGRAHWQTQVWINGSDVGMNDQLSTPHEFYLGKLRAGDHKLTIRVDNRMIYNVGVNAHSVSDHTQSNWNGIIGKLEIKLIGPVIIKDVKVFPDLEHSTAKLKIEIWNISSDSISGRIQTRAESFNSENKHQPKQQIEAIELPPGITRLEIDYKMGKGFLTWDEFSPALYNMLVLFTSGNSGIKITRETTFGMRDFVADETQFAVNGKTIFLRGTLECCIFPITGYPPMNTETWLKNFKIARDYGLNHIRFHSWCPPEPAFIAADQLGIYLQVECPAWTTIGNGDMIDEYIMHESQRILNEYGNHPSFCMFAYGNEPGGDEQVRFLTNFVEYWKGEDPRRVYTGAAGWPVMEVNDYQNIPKPRGHQWGANLSSRFNREPLTMEYDYSSILESYDKPVVSHEIGQWCVFPDLTEIEKYTGVLKAKNFEIVRDRLEDKGMLHQAEEFLMASGKWQTKLYKEEIETALRTPGFAGFQLLDLHDFPGQGTALVGVLNPFWEEKGYVTESEFRQFCSSIVPLVRMPKVVYSNSELFQCEIVTANYGAVEIEETILWEILDEEGNIYSSEQIDSQHIPQGRLMESGRIKVDLQQVKRATRFTLSISLERSKRSNEWTFWVLPDKHIFVPEREIHTTTEWNETIEQILENGGNVLFSIPKRQVNPEVPPGFTTIFWNTAWTRNQLPHTLGILCDPKHPALLHFPTQYHSDWPWFDLVHDVSPLVMDDLPDELSPIIQGIDDWNKCRKLGFLFEAKLGNGKLIVTTIDLTNELKQRPVAGQLLHSVLKYMDSEYFNPSIELNRGQILAFIKE